MAKLRKIRQQGSCRRLLPAERADKVQLVVNVSHGY